MGSPNTGALVQITPGDGKNFRALFNNSDAVVTVNVTVNTGAPGYGEQTYDMAMQPFQLTPNDCVVNTASATIFGYLKDDT